MKITCPTCAFVIDAGDVPDTLLSVIGDGTLTVRCPGCASEIELAALTATLHYAGSSSTSRGTLVRTDAMDDWRLNRDPGCCYCDDCRGDGRRDPTVTHDPSKPTDTSDAACDARFDGLVGFLEGFVRPYFEDQARRRAWGLGDPEPIPV